MELVLKRKMSLWEQVHQFFGTKGSNIFYEREQPIGASFDSIMEDIFTESGFESVDRLVIVDQYFTNICCNDADAVAESFLKWVSDKEISEVQIYTKERKNCFENRLRDKNFVYIFPYQTSKVHDRFWLFFHGGELHIVAVGASFNGFAIKASSLFYVVRVKDEHRYTLLQFLKDAKIDFEKKGNADVNSDR